MRQKKYRGIVSESLLFSVPVFDLLSPIVLVLSVLVSESLAPPSTVSESESIVSPRIVYSTLFFENSFSLASCL